MDLGLEGKVALVTASSKGLGRGAAMALSQEGARLVICARGAEALQETASQLPGESLALALDVTDPDAPRRLVEAAVERFGGLDIVVANSGGPPRVRALDIDEQGLDSALNANLKTSLRLALEAVPHMRSRGWGRICFITSYGVKQPIPELAYSNVARVGLAAWAKTAAADLAGEGITVNVVCPGLHATDRVKDLGVTARLGDPEDLGRVVAFLCSEPAAFVSGVTLLVDGAATVGLL